MTCCLETALITALRALDGTPILDENHFVLERTCGECIPYLAVKTKSRGGLRTSSFQQIKHDVVISAYFSNSKLSQAMEYRAILEEWISSSGCLDLGACGCFCVDSVPDLGLAISSDKIRCNLSFSGSYQPAAVESLSASV